MLKGPLHIFLAAILYSYLFMAFKVYSQENQPDIGKWSLGIYLSADHHIGESKWATSKSIGLLNIQPTTVLFTSTFMAEYQISQKFTISSGLGLSGKDLVGYFFCAFCDHWGPHPPVRVNLRFFEVPIQLSYGLWGNDLRGFVLGGIIYSYLLNQPNKYLKTSHNSIFSLQTGAGVIKYFNERARLNLNFVYKRSITKIFENADVNFRTLGLTFGLVYGFPK